MTVFGTSFAPPSTPIHPSADPSHNSDVGVGVGVGVVGDSDGTVDEGRYLVACSSEGVLLVWDLCRPPVHRQRQKCSGSRVEEGEDPLSTVGGRRRNRDLDGSVTDGLAPSCVKKRRVESTMDHDPILR